MARPRKNKSGLPSYCYRRATTRGYRYVMHIPDPENAGKLISRGYGDDLHKMLDDWARIWGQVTDYQTLGDVMTLYAARVIPTKAPRTQVDYRKHLESLRPVFGAMRPDRLEPTHILRWQEARGAQSVTQCNHEKAVLSGVMQLALRLGVARSNPCRYVKKLTERPRDRDVTEGEFEAVYNIAGPLVRVAMLLAVITGMRQGDLLALRRDQAHDDGIHLRQRKTSRPLIIEWSPALREAWQQATTLRRVRSFYVLCTEHGQQYTGDGFRSLWQRAMATALESGALAERYTFHDLRAKAGGDAADWRLLGHTSETLFRRVYDRKPRRVKPAK